MLNKLVLGTAQFGLDYGINNSNGKVKLNEVYKILDFAFENNILTLDTATSYGNAELLIGNYFKENPEKEFKIITKISSYDKTLEEQMYNSIQRLNIEKIECLFFHSLSLYKHFLKELESFKKKFKGIKFEEIGVSIYTDREIDFIVDENQIDRVQLPFNLLDNSSLRKKSILKLHSKGIKVDARSIFLQGLFFKPFRTLHPYFKPLIDDLRKINKITVELNQSIDEVAIKYVYQKEFINRVVIGVDSLEHFKTNVEFLKQPILNDYSKIDSIVISNRKLLYPYLWPK